MRKVREKVPLVVCQNRALAALSKTRLLPASTIAEAIWPGTVWKPQGAGAAASRILKGLERDGLVAWTVRGEGPSKSWGWYKL